MRPLTLTMVSNTRRNQSEVEPLIRAPKDDKVAGIPLQPPVADAKSTLKHAG